MAHGIIVLHFQAQRNASCQEFNDPEFTAHVLSFPGRRRTPTVSPQKFTTETMEYDETPKSVDNKVLNPSDLLWL